MKSLPYKIHSQPHIKAALDAYDDAKLDAIAAVIHLVLTVRDTPDCNSPKVKDSASNYAKRSQSLSLARDGVKRVLPSGLSCHLPL